MQINRLSFIDVIDSLRVSIERGQQNYLVFFLGSLSFTIFHWIFEQFGSVVALLATPLIVFQAVGFYHVGQVAFQKHREPKLSDFFIGFQNLNLIRRLYKYLLALILLTIVSLVVAGVCLTIFSKHILRIGEIGPQAGTLFAIFILLLMSPLYGLDAVLLFQRFNFQESLKINLRGLFKNFAWFLLALLVYGLYLSALTKFVEMIDVTWVKTHSKKIPSLVSLPIAPFFVVHGYQIFTRVFTFDAPLVELETAGPYVESPPHQSGNVD